MGLRVERVAVSGWDHVGGSARTRGDAWKRRLAFWWAGVPGSRFGSGPETVGTWVPIGT